MNGNLSIYKKDLAKLTTIGEKMLWDTRLRSQDLEGKTIKSKSGELNLQEFKERIKGSFESEYQLWYTEALSVVKQLIPQRLVEFEFLYKGDARRKGINTSTYAIQDWMTGVRSGEDGLGEKFFDDFSIAINRFSAQLEILKAANSRFDNSLYDLRHIVQADFFDSELDSAQELLRKGFLRAAGAIAGVVLEKHLSEVCGNHSIKLRKKNLNISYFYELLKNNDVIDIATWRSIQRLGDLRNLCDHNKDRDPTKEEVAELLAGVDKASKTIF